MIEFYSETDFKLLEQKALQNWIIGWLKEENFEAGEIVYIFCNDEYLHDLNLKYLDHDALTDVIGFDNSMGREISGEIYISVDRVAENADIYKVDFNEELYRVMAHGLLHFCGYDDKNDEDRELMRAKEDEMLNTLLKT